MKRCISPLPLLDGVKSSYLVLLHEKQSYGLPLLHFLRVYFPLVGEENWWRQLNSGFAVGVGGVPFGENTLSEPGKAVFYYRETSRESELRIPFGEKILHTDKHLLVVDKPHFLPAILSGRFLRETLLMRLHLRSELQHSNVEDITPIHRLDKDMAGAMLLSLSPATRRNYQTMFQEKTVQKIHEAVVSTRTDLDYLLYISSRMGRGERFFLTRETEGKPNAYTIIEPTENRDALNLYRLAPHTGKKHQLRVHMISLNMPLMNDALYPTPLAVGDEDYDKLLKLLTKGIESTDPVSGEVRVFESHFTL